MDHWPLELAAMAQRLVEWLEESEKNVGTHKHQEQQPTGNTFRD